MQLVIHFRNMGLRSCAVACALLVMGVIVTVVLVPFSRVRSAGISIGVDTYKRDAEQVTAALVLTNTGDVSLAVPLRFGCEVKTASDTTNYFVNTRYSVFLHPAQYVVLSNKLWCIGLPADTSAWKINMRIRHMSRRERLSDALRRTGSVNPRLLSRLAGRPGKQTNYRWFDVESGWLEAPVHNLNKPLIAEDEQRTPRVKKQEPPSR